MNKFKEIRPIVLGLAKKDNKILVCEGFDTVKNQTFYRYTKRVHTFKTFYLSTSSRNYHARFE